MERYNIQGYNIAVYIPEKGLVSRICKELSNLNSKVKSNPNESIQVLNR